MLNEKSAKQKNREVSRFFFAFFMALCICGEIAVNSKFTLLAFKLQRPSNLFYPST